MQETQEMRVQSQGQEDALEEEVATHSSVLSWRILWTKEPRGLQAMGHGVRLDWVTNFHFTSWKLKSSTTIAGMQ